MAVREITLIQVNAGSNANKFYRVHLDNGTITKTWGRVGSAGQSRKETGNETEFEKIVLGKERRGYKQVEIESSTNAAQPSRSIRAAELKVVATQALGGGVTAGPLYSALSFMAEQNRHDIIKASGGMLTVDTSGIVKTPLGIVSAKSLTAASAIIDKISKSTGTVKESLIEEYLTLVPQKVASRDWVKHIFKDQSDFDAQQGLLRALRTSVDMYESGMKTALKDTPAKTSDANLYRDLFNCSLTEVVDSAVLSKINKLYTGSINSVHSSRGLRVKHVFELKYSDSERSRFDDAAALGNVRQLWHGTDAGNVLSILREGLYCPPVNAAAFKISGRMFGPGVYFSDQSTKALNYSNGFWGGQRTNRSFMFLADVVMGNEYRPNRDKASGGAFSLSRAHKGKDAHGRPFNSISIKGGTCSVLNNEMIVWEKSQIALRYLIEFH